MVSDKAIHKAFGIHQNSIYKQYPIIGFKDPVI